MFRKRQSSLFVVLSGAIFDVRMQVLPCSNASITVGAHASTGSGACNDEFINILFYVFRIMTKLKYNAKTSKNVQNITLKFESGKQDNGKKR